MSQRRWRVIAIGSVLLVGLAAASASAATFHVSPQGSNTPPYDTYAKAATKMDVALLAASGYGDTILVHAGVYNTDTLWQVPLGSVWAGVGRDSVIVNMSNTAYGSWKLARLQGDNTVTGMEFNYPRGSGFSYVSALIGYGADTIVIENCRFRELAITFGGLTDLNVHDNEFYFGQGWGVGWSGLSAWIHNNHFYGRTSGHGVSMDFAHSTLVEHNVFNTDHTGGAYTAVYIEDGTTATIRNNLILNSSDGIEWFETSGIVENNTMIRGVGTFIGLEFFLEPVHSLIFRNNILVDFARLPMFGPACGNCPPTGPLTYVHNVIWPPRDSTYTIWPYASPDSVTLIDSVNVFAYAMFEDDSLYHLQAGSPLIDTGDPSILDADGSCSDIGWTGGPGGIIPDYPEMPPFAPDTANATGTDGIISLCWTSRPEADLAGYNLYRGDESGFWSEGLTPYRVFAPDDTCASDTILAAGENVYYVVTAFDTAGMESAASPEVSYMVTGVLDGPDGDLLPRSASILRAYPNPFNDATVIEFAVSVSAGSLHIDIFNILGQRVDRVELGRQEAGVHSVAWSAAVPSGVYFARLASGDLKLGRTVKLAVLR